eukprot:TRINITY_DN2762_c0_g1_i2.p1 TRINITY_DN2762_c0_g1~~TRINITY_DN2762_c0_g1_i2.p1  ORF type:complete len:584 (-),score=98.60 TRINITY_DN2762_c0_g1_i2:82-1629(-)
MYSPEDSPLAAEASSIEYQIGFTIPSHRSLSLHTSSRPIGEIVLVHSRELVQVGTGHVLFMNQHYCCTFELFSSKKCNNLGSLIVHNLIENVTTVADSASVPGEQFRTYVDGSQNGNRLHYAVVDKRHYFSSNGLTVDQETDYAGVYTANLNVTLPIQSTGVYYVLIANCDESSHIQIEATGLITSKNPYGYLDGEFVGNLFAFWIMGILYFLVLSVYLFFAFRYRKDLTRFQIAFGVVIFISFLEQLVWAWSNTRFNDVGEFVEEMNALGAVLTALKETSIRFLLILVASGYRITRNDLDRFPGIVGVVTCVLYFSVSCALEIIVVKEEEGTPVDSTIRFGFEVFDSLLNIGIFLWIAFMLKRMLDKLNKERQAAKYWLYYRLLVLCLAALAFSGIIYLFQVVLESEDVEDEFFRWWWLWETYWEFFYFAVLVYLAVVWRPNELNLRYAYSELASTDPSEQQMEEIEQAEVPIDLGSSESDTEVSTESPRVESAPVDVEDVDGMQIEVDVSDSI